MPAIETRVLSRLLVSFSRPESGDGENLSAAEMLTVVDITHEFPNVHAKLVKLFETTSAIAAHLEAEPGYRLKEDEQKIVLNFFQVVEKAGAFQRGEDKELDFLTGQGLEGIL